MLEMMLIIEVISGQDRYWLIGCPSPASKKCELFTNLSSMRNAALQMRSITTDNYYKHVASLKRYCVIDRREGINHFQKLSLVKASGHLPLLILIDYAASVQAWESGLK
jgi:hypothetical protein